MVRIIIGILYEEGDMAGRLERTGDSPLTRPQHPTGDDPERQHEDE